MRAAHVTGTNGIASFLAVLIMVGSMMSVAKADEMRVSPPLAGSDPVVLHLVAGTPEAADPSDLLQVFVDAGDPCCEGRTPIAGRYARAGHTLAFSPAFGFEAGQDYVARVGAEQDEPALVRFRIPVEAQSRPAAVTRIYPSGATLPENVLRFYIHFAVPMAPHVAFDYITLADASGNVDEAAFMRFKQELWNEDRTRLTVLMDPGRIKRNVATNLELGPALVEGGTYTLSARAGWPSADGMSALPAFSKRFTVTEPLRERPDVGEWQVASPCRGTKEPLGIVFDRPFDRHLLGRAMGVRTGDGQVMEGTIEVSDGERRWAFIPDEPWPTEDVQVLVNAELEDVAANNFRDLLDHLGSDEVVDVSTLTLPVGLSACGD